MHQELQFAKEKIQLWRDQAALEAQLKVAKPAAFKWLRLSWPRLNPARRHHA